ncbi:MAG: acyl carrier protein [Azospirillum sp.]|nr:acyl carrier protein [Azospirillum sp.]
MQSDIDVRKWVIDHLVAIAPEIDPAMVDPEVSFRDQFEFDSVDFLNFVLAIEDELGRRIPEVEYPKLSTLEGCVAWLTPVVNKLPVAS